MVRTPRSTPAELAPEPWPEKPAEDPAAETARLFVRNLRRAIGGRSIRAVANLAGLSHATLLSVLAGRTWPDLETIAKLEHGLDEPIWPAR
jgi:lambda repressor-like predicted transcriptional regulator